MSHLVSYVSYVSCNVILDMWWQNKATTFQVDPRFIYLLMHENAKLDPFKCDTWGLLSSIFEFHIIL